jgi:hypothetical protein
MSSRRGRFERMDFVGLGLVAIVPVLLVVFIVALFTTGSTIRRRIAVVGKDNRIRSEWVKDSHIHRENGHPWYVFRKEKYDWSGDWYEFEYRLVRSFGLRKYVGTQRIYLEGNPTPYRFFEDERMAALTQTAKDLFIEAESDLPNRVMKPRRVDPLLLFLMVIIGLAVGFALGGRF